MGLVAISGVGEQGWERIRAARESGPFVDLRDLCIRTRLPPSTIADLIRAGACDALGERRDLLWQLGEIDYRPDDTPALPLAIPPTEVELLALDDFEATMWEYELLGLSPGGQIMQHHRAALERAGALTTAGVKAAQEKSHVRAGQRPRVVRVGGLMVARQRPGTAKGILFVSIEDETGLLDLVVKPEVYERYRQLLRHQPFILVEGTVQRAQGVVNVLVTRALEFPRYKL